MTRDLSTSAQKADKTTTPESASAPLLLSLEFARADQTGDAYGFRFVPQEYSLRRDGGKFKSARFPWEPQLLTDLHSLRLPGRDPAVLQSIGETLRRSPPRDLLLLYKPSKELLGRTVCELLPGDLAEEFLAKANQAVLEKKVVSLEYSLEIRGAQVFFLGSISSMAEDQVVFVARDVTDRKLAEQQMLHQQIELIRAQGASRGPGRAIDIAHPHNGYRSVEEGATHGPTETRF